MTSTIHIFDWHGHYIDELDAATVRSWVTNNGAVNDVGVCTWDMATGDTKCIEKNLRFGNLVLIRHLTLPDWVGVIDTPRAKDYESIGVTAYSAEKILQWRGMPTTKLKGSAGAMFAQILGFANKLQGTPIQPGSIFLDASNLEEELSDSAYDHCVNIAKNSGNDWDVTYQIDTDGNLNLFGNWYESRGVDTGLTIDDSRKSIDANLTEEGEIWNVIYGFGESSTNDTRFKSTQTDTESMALYGPRSINWNDGSVTNKAAVETGAKKFLEKNKSTLHRISPTIPEASDIAPYLQIGNKFYAESILSNNTQNGFDFSGRVRLDVVEYDDLACECVLGAETI